MSNFEVIDQRGNQPKLLTFQALPEKEMFVFVNNPNVFCVKRDSLNCDYVQLHENSMASGEYRISHDESFHEVRKIKLTLTVKWE